MSIVYTHATLADPSDALQMVESEASLRCASCRDEIHTSPIMFAERAYCCGGCAEGGPCSC